jgi:hypothetical protein
MAFVGVTDSFEAYYQAVRRCWRFGQTRDVHVHIFASRRRAPSCEPEAQRARRQADGREPERRDARRRAWQRDRHHAANEHLQRRRRVAVPAFLKDAA